MARHSGVAAGGLSTAVAMAALASLARAHEHHDEDMEAGKYISDDPIDSVLWIHIMLQTFAWGVLFPTGMVLGIVRSRWHVPLQVVATCLAVLGWFLGHAHGGRSFAHNIHGAFAPTLMLLLIVQVCFGVYLKLHLERGIHGRIRPYFVRAHGVVGKVMPVATWVQFIFGGITAMGFCHEDHLGQCLAHFIMGSAFIGYGIVLVILLLVGQAWLRRTGRSQEFFDSLLIAAWGCVNTFTEHRWGQAWGHNDVQHTTMGIVWWCAGLVGIWLSRTRDGRPKRNIIPGLVILLTGFAMSAHPQHLELSTHVHTVFGYTLMAAGLTRMIEVAFVLKDRNSYSDDEADINSFQHLPPFLLFASGFLFMAATEEQMAVLSDAHISHVSYVLVLYSFAFLLYLFVNMLLHLYYTHTKPKSKDGRAVNGQPNGHIRGANSSERRRVQDAEEFELAGLMSDDDDDESTPKNKERTNDSS